MVVGLAGPALAQTETRRAPANDPSTILGNALFTIHNRLVSPEPEFEAQEAAGLGGKDKRDQLLAEIQRLDADGLAQRYARNLEGLLSMSIMFDVMRGLYPDQAVFLATEQRFVTVSRSGTGWAVEVPDRPSELYAAPLGARALVLGGRERKTCTITLARASSGVK